MRLLLACGILLFAAQAVEARTPRGIIECDMRGCRSEVAAQPARAEYRQRTKHQHQAKRDRRKSYKVASAVISDSRAVGRSQERVLTHETRLVDHPEGCPRTSFCGCGVAVKVFGRPIRDLWLAANWFRYKIAEAAPGMVAVRRHHVFYIVEVVGHGRVLAYDPNSGGHKTRIHLRSLAGYRVVDPRSS